jgi:hypothetical protein
VTHGLDVVAVGIEHERTVIVRVIARAQAGRAIVLAACGERRAMEGVDGRPIVGVDRNMQNALEPSLAADPEIRLAVLAEAGGRAVAFLSRLRMLLFMASSSRVLD